MLVLGSAGSAAFSASLNLSLFSLAHNPNPNTSHFAGYTRDRSTGLIYKSDWYQSPQVDVFNSVSDFQNNAVASSTTLDTDHLGTYAVVRNGKYYSRTGITSASDASRLNVATGATEVTQNFASIDPTNGTATFDWGGYSSLNFFDDVTGLYVYGKDFSGNHTIFRVDNNLNVLSSFTFAGNTGADSSFGFAFNVKGYLFLGSDYSSNNIETRVNLLTGAVSSVSHSFTGLPGPYLPYYSHVWYDDIDDRLYVNYTTGFETDGMYSVDNVASTLGVVPEPASMTALGLGLAALLRKRKSR